MNQTMRSEAVTPADAIPCRDATRLRYLRVARQSGGVGPEAVQIGQMAIRQKVSGGAKGVSRYPIGRWDSTGTVLRLKIASRGNVDWLPITPLAASAPGSRQAGPISPDA